MLNNKYIVSHSPFIHIGNCISNRSYNIIAAAFLAILPSFFTYGAPAIGAVCLAISSAMLWELLMNVVSKSEYTIGDGNAATIGIVFSMLLPATVPWWVVITGTGIAVVMGKTIYGGIGANPFNPVLIGYALLKLSWGDLLSIDESLLNYNFDYTMASAIDALKNIGVESVDKYTLTDLFLGKQAGGMGSTCGLALLAGGLYLIVRGMIRWEICVSFLTGIILTSLIFNLADPSKFAGPMFHVFTGFTLVGAIFLATEDSSSPVNFIPMLIYGLGCGVMIILIRNIGKFPDGVVLAIIVMNIVSPLIDKIRTKSRGKGSYA